MKRDLVSRKNFLERKLKEVHKQPGQSVKEFCLQNVMAKFIEGDLVGCVQEAEMYTDTSVAERVLRSAQEAQHGTFHSFDAVAIIKRKAGA